MGGIPTKYTGEVLTIDEVKRVLLISVLHAELYHHRTARIKLYLDCMLLAKPPAFLYTVLTVLERTLCWILLFSAVHVHTISRTL